MDAYLLVSITSCIVNAAVYNLFSPFYLIAAIYQRRCPVSSKRKLTAVCSHQTRIGNLDAHLI
ncbi:hypothetical protein B2H83_18505 [Escherichia coli M8]|nr:hypothetical protein B2H83_18505 [Escherichia coli M8]